MPLSGPAGRLAKGALAAAAVASLAALGLSPPAPRGAGAPAREFSAARALALAKELVGDGAPRTAGSEAGRAAALRLVGLVRAAGFEAEVQEAFACGIYGACARVVNVLGRLGQPGKKAVLLVAHHDSAGAGPGASDDAAGVAAILEAARALAAGPPPPRPVLLLFTDSEETGLVGATAFVEGHRWAREVGAAVNLEARGTEGPSLVFDAAGDPAWLVRALRSVRRPLASSLFPAIYHLVPNETDLTALERGGLSGVNLAFAFGAVRYHTPRDDVAHLDPSSLQHQGENALALARALAAEDLDRAGTRRTVFFDVLGAFVVAWPESAALPVALLSLLAVLAALALLRRRGLSARGAAAGFAAAIAAPVAGFAATLLAWLALRHGALPGLFVAYPEPFVAAAWAAGAGGALLAAAAAAPVAGAAGLFLGGGALFAILGIALAAALPGASHLAVIPALGFGAAGLLLARSRPASPGWPLAASLVPAVAAGLVLFPPALLAPPMLGVPASALAAALVALALLPLAPLVAALGGRSRWAPAAGAFALAFVLAGVAAALPHATRDAPERLPISWVEEDGRARIAAEAGRDALPAAVRALAPFGPRREKPFPWMPHRPAFLAPADPLGLPSPRLDVLSSAVEGGVRRIRARLSSPRGAPILALLLPPGADVASFAMEGVPVKPVSPKVRWWFGGHGLYACVSTPPGGVEIDVALRGTAPVEALLVDQSHGLPPAAAPLAAARPPTAVTSHDGDLTVAVTRVKL